MTTENRDKLTPTDTDTEKNEHDPNLQEYEIPEAGVIDAASEKEVDGVDINDSSFTKKVPIKKKPLQTFYTREIAKTFGREEFLIGSLKEAFMYLIFLSILTFVTFGYSKLSSFHYTDTMETLFTKSLYTQTVKSHAETTNDFTRMNTMGDVLSYLLLMMYIVSYTKNATGIRKETSRTMEDNILIGYMQLRQVRVRNDSCKIPDHFKLMFTDCYGPYSELTEDKKTFGLQSGEAWTYKSAYQLASSMYSGEVAHYGGGGYCIHLVRHREVLIADYYFMTKYFWINRGTRALFMDLATYNANVNLLGIIKLVVEFPHTGGVIPKSNIRVVRLISDITPSDVILLILEFIIVVFTMYFTCEEIYEMYYFKLDYIKSFWNWLDLILVILLYIKILLTMYSLVTTSIRVLPVLLSEKHRIEFDAISISYTLHSVSMALTVFPAWIKALKYLTVFNTMCELQTAMGKAAASLLWFSVIFLTVFLSFALLGHLLFGSEVKGLRSVTYSFFTLISTVIGNVNYREIENADYLLGSVFFSFFIFVVFFILVNIFTAILVYAYEEVRNEVRDLGSVELSVFDLINRWQITLLYKMKYRDQAARQEAKALLSKAKANYEYICNLLYRRGYSKVQIGLFWAKYSITDYEDTVGRDMQDIIADLHTLSAESAKRMVVDSYHQLYFKMNERVNDLEDAVVTANQKVSMILDKIDALHQIQAAKRSEGI